MATLLGLKREAGAACRWRGHRMGPWEHNAAPVGLADAAWCECRDCGAYVGVHTNPPPNGIDVHGEAVALGCGDEEVGRDA
jgi:hypothetical protein